MKIILTWLVLFVFAEAKGLSLNDMKKEARVAFIIENVDYDGVASKSNIANVEGIQKFLEDNNFKVIYLKNSNRSDTIRSFRSFNSKLKEGGIALFYFRGHAVQVNNKNYLLPTDVLENGQSSISKSLSIDAVLGSMNKSNSRMNMIVIDSVYNSKLSTSLSIKKKGLAAFNVAKNTALVVSSKMNSNTRDAKFTKQLLEIFKEKGLSTRDGFSKLKKQNNMAYVKVSNQDFYFKLPSKLLSAEDKLWAKSLKLGSLDALTLYKKTYPSGKHTTKAKSLIEKIELKKAKLEKAKAKKMAFEAEVKRQVELELERINKAKEKERLAKLQKEKKQAAKKLAPKKLAVVPPVPKAKVYKKAFYIEPEMVNIVATPEQKAFEIGRYEVSNKEYKAFLQATQNNKNLSRYDRIADQPVTNVTFEEAKEYATWLSAMSGKKYTIPTEEQWEHAARAGTDTNYFWGNKDVSMKKAFWLQDKPNNAHLYTWMKSNSNEVVHSIGEKEQNPWGLYDIYGNAGEWCINTDADQTQQALRGGSFLSSSKEIQSSAKVYKPQTYKSIDLGFRLVKEI